LAPFRHLRGLSVLSFGLELGLGVGPLCCHDNGRQKIQHIMETMTTVNVMSVRTVNAGSQSNRDYIIWYVLYSM
jgi:hypothetical protein